MLSYKSIITLLSNKFIRVDCAIPKWCKLEDVEEKKC